MLPFYTVGPGLLPNCSFEIVADSICRMDNSKDKNEGKGAEDQLSGLSSNPEHPLQKAAEEKTSKTVS